MDLNIKHISVGRNDDGTLIASWTFLVKENPGFKIEALKILED